MMIGQEIGTLGHADADRHDRLAERDDDDQAVPLGEVARGRQPPAGRAAERGADVVDHQRQHPQCGLHPALELRRDQQHDRATRHAGREPDQLRPQPGDPPER